MRLINYNIIYNRGNCVIPYHRSVTTRDGSQTTCTLAQIIETMKKTIDPNITFESHVFEVLSEECHKYLRMKYVDNDIIANATIVVNNRRRQPFKCSVELCITEDKKYCFDVETNNCYTEGHKYEKIDQNCSQLLTGEGLFTLRGVNHLFVHNLEIFDDNLNRFVAFDMCSQLIPNGCRLKITTDCVLTQNQWIERLNLALNSDQLANGDLMKSYQMFKKIAFNEVPHNYEKFIDFLQVFLKTNCKTSEPFICDQLWHLYNRAVQSFVDQHGQSQTVSNNTSIAGQDMQSNNSGHNFRTDCDQSLGSRNGYPKNQSKPVLNTRKVFPQSESESSESEDSSDSDSDGKNLVENSRNYSKKCVDKEKNKKGKVSSESEDDSEEKSSECVVICEDESQNKNKSKDKRKGINPKNVTEIQSKEVVVKNEVMSETDSESHESSDSEDINDSKSERDYKNSKIGIVSKRKSVVREKTKKGKVLSDCVVICEDEYQNRKNSKDKRKGVKREVSDSQEESEQRAKNRMKREKKSKKEVTEGQEKSDINEEVDYYLILSLNNCLQSMANQVLSQTSTQLWKNVSFQIMFDHKKPEMNETECQIRFEELFAKYLRVLSTFKTPFEASLSFKCFDLFNALDLQLLDSLADNWRQRLVTNLLKDHKLKTQSDNSLIEYSTDIKTENE